MNSEQAKMKFFCDNNRCIECFGCSVACTDAPCAQVCPVNCFYIREDGIVLHDKEKCIGCGDGLYACPFGTPQFPRDGALGTKGAMDKCTMCAGGPEETNSEEERHLYGQNRIAEGKVPICAARR